MPLFMKPIEDTEDCVLGADGRGPVRGKNLLVDLSVPRTDNS